MRRDRAQRSCARIVRRSRAQGSCARIVRRDPAQGSCARNSHSPPSVSCQTIPSKVTEVPGSQGPKHSGSVMVPTLVPTHTSDMSCKFIGELCIDARERDKFRNARDRSPHPVQPFRIPFATTAILRPRRQPSTRL